MHVPGTVLKTLYYYLSTSYRFGNSAPNLTIQAQPANPNQESDHTCLYYIAYTLYRNARTYPTNTYNSHYKHPRTHLRNSLIDLNAQRNNQNPQE